MPKDDVMSITTQPLDLNFLIKFIDKFDGSREALNPFLINCGNAIKLATSAQQDILFKYILSQLTGRAQIACSIKEFQNWEQLEEFLKSQFGEKKHYAHLLVELQNCKQQNSETVSQFSLKVETCLARLLTEIDISIPTNKKLEVAGRVAAMQDLALHTFVMGLDNRISTIVRCRNPGTLNEAINFAVEEEKIVTSSFRKSVPPSSFRNAFDRGQQSRYTAPQPRQPSRPFNSNAPNFYCRYCKNPGHTIENCKKREYNNSKRANNFNDVNNQPSTSGYKPQRRVNHILERYEDPESRDEVDIENPKND